MYVTFPSAVAKDTDARAPFAELTALMEVTPVRTIVFDTFIGDGGSPLPPPPGPAGFGALSEQLAPMTARTATPRLRNEIRRRSGATSPGTRCATITVIASPSCVDMPFLVH